ncbi:hypothetical protein CH75_08865 [Dyella jiangningensis]|jgi:hypothetical protein|nr:hypothetical protein CH75_08865 [Dyella jiangningensis]
MDFFLRDHPLVLFATSLVVLWLAGWAGVALSRWHHPNDSGISDTFGVLMGATLTLLALIIGFTFSMAVSRYDQRKNFEESEANAIGTEYLRLGLLDDASAARARGLLADYLAQRIQFYETRDGTQVAQIEAKKAALQPAMWKAVEAPAKSGRDCVVALVTSGMNDVLNSEGYTQASWWNRIPTAAWFLMLLIAVVSHLLVGFGGARLRAEPELLLILPISVAISFMLIADIDSPRGGVIRVLPHNLIAVEASLQPH